MKCMIVGLGSMGKRRARCLKHLGHTHIVGFDVNPDRVAQANTAGIVATQHWQEVDLNTVDAIFICTPPDQHEHYMMLAIEYAKPAFIEASVILGRLAQMDEQAKQSNVLLAPSCTLMFHPAIKAIKKIIDEKTYGNMTNFSYHCGQYLPDWHPWEAVSDFYVSNPLTGGCREIVPFELTWLVDCFGLPQKGSACVGRSMDVGASIDDTYAIALQFNQGFGNVLVDVTSRYALRQLIMNFEQAQLHWRWDENCLKIYEVAKKDWHQQTFTSLVKQQAEYNPNIIEDMYIEEVNAFLSAIQGKAEFPNTLSKDIQILTILHHLEKGHGNEILP